MIPDLLNIYLPIKELQQYALRRNIPAAYLVSNKMALLTLTLALTIWFISAIIL